MIDDTRKGRSTTRGTDRRALLARYSLLGYDSALSGKARLNGAYPRYRLYLFGSNYGGAGPGKSSAGSYSSRAAVPAASYRDRAWIGTRTGSGQSFRAR